jgi:surface antigen
MTLRTTTPVSKSRVSVIAKRAGLILIALVITLAGLRFATNNASADQYDDKISALQADMAQYQQQADILNSQAVSLQNTVAQLDNQRQALQAQVDLNQAQYDQLTAQIADTQAKIKTNQDALGATIADLYVDDSTSPIELLASSTNISDFLNKQEYRNSIRDQLSSTIKTVKDLKSKLDAQQASVAKVLAEQKTARDSLVANENQQQALLNQTNNSEAAYQALIKNNAAQIAEARATQAAINARIHSSGGYVLIDAGSLSAYPWNSSNCPMSYYYSTGGADGNGGDGHGYGCRQCASYVAWRIAKETGIYYSWGNAVNFTQNAKNAGYVEGAPMAGSIAVMDPATAGASEGHVAWVEAVSGDKVTVSQYNYDYGQGYGMYSEMVLSASAFDHYIKIK